MAVRRQSVRDLKLKTKTSTLKRSLITVPRLSMLNSLLNTDLVVGRNFLVLACVTQKTRARSDATSFLSQVQGSVTKLTPFHAATATRIYFLHPLSLSLSPPYLCHPLSLSLSFPPYLIILFPASLTFTVTPRSSRITFTFAFTRTPCARRVATSGSDFLSCLRAASHARGQVLPLLLPSRSLLAVPYTVSVAVPRVLGHTP